MVVANDQVVALDGVELASVSLSVVLVDHKGKSVVDVMTVVVLVSSPLGFNVVVSVVVDGSILTEITLVVFTKSNASN